MIYKLNKAEYKQITKEFANTYYGKNIYLGVLSTLIVAVIFSILFGYNLGYNSALNDKICMTTLGYVSLILAIISLFMYFAFAIIFNIELRKYYESKNK